MRNGIDHSPNRRKNTKLAQPEDRCLVRLDAIRSPWRTVSEPPALGGSRKPQSVRMWLASPILTGPTGKLARCRT